MKFETILVRSQDSVALVTLNRPEKLNAMSMVLKEELIRALRRLVGLGNAMKLTLPGDRIDAAEALRIGLVDEVVPNARLEPRTFAIAGKIAAHSALAVRLAKAAIRASTRLPLDQGLRYEQTLFALAMASADKEEGVQAFLEKREAQWKDR